MKLKAVDHSGKRLMPPPTNLTEIGSSPTGLCREFVQSLDFGIRLLGGGMNFSNRESLPGLPVLNLMGVVPNVSGA